MGHRGRRIFLPLVLPVVFVLMFFYGAPVLAGRSPESDFNSLFVQNNSSVASPLQQLSSITITTNTTWYSASIALDTLVVTNSATLTLARPTGHTGAITITANAITVGITSVVTLDGQGYAKNTGLGSTSSQGDGAGHGGYGGGGGSLEKGHTQGGSSYGNPYFPGMLGSGGRDGSPTLTPGVSIPGGAGGGAIHLIVTDTLHIDGRLSANGRPGGNGSAASSRGGGGGSGGSIWVESGTLTGSGTMEANGGNGGHGQFVTNGGGGAGGRIAVYSGEDGFSPFVDGNGSLSAYGGANNEPLTTSIAFHYGGPGTVLIQEDANPVILVVDNYSHTHTYHFATLPTGTYDFGEIHLTNGGNLEFQGSSSVLTITNDTIVGDGTGHLNVVGRVFAPTELTFDGALLEVQGDLVGPESITTTLNGGLQLHAASPWRNGVFTFTNITIEDGTRLLLSSHTTTSTTYSNDMGVELRVGNLTIESGGVLSADGLGYGPGYGPGRPSPSTYYGGGGAHGGNGGNGRFGLSAGTGGTAYCEIYTPLTPGSGGARLVGSSSSQVGRGGAGGGSIHLVVSEAVTINGLVSANGQDGQISHRDDSYDSPDGAGGAGGGILIETVSLIGGGAIEANGGKGGAPGNAANQGTGAGGGSGGCIAIYADADTSSLSLLVDGGLEQSGNPSVTAGAVGTIFLNTIQPVSSTVSLTPTTITANGSDTSTASVTVVNVNNLPMPDIEVSFSIAPTSGISIDGTPVTVFPIVIGTTNSSGTITATVASTNAGVKTITAYANDIPLQATPTVTFTAGGINTSVSDLVIVGPTQVPADGTTTLEVMLIARDMYGNPVAGATPVITATGSATVTLSGTTNASGEVTGEVTNDTIETIALTASLNGQVLPDVLTATFRGPDVTLSKSAWALSNNGPSSTHALGGFPITYTLDIENPGLLDATEVVVTDTLPLSLTFITQTSLYTFTQNGNELVWEVGTLGDETSGEIVVVAQIDADLTGTITNTAVITASIDDTPDNNGVTRPTIVEEPQPQLLVSPAAPTLVVAPDDSTERVVTIYNIGVAALSDFTVTIPATLTWVTADTTGLPSSLPVGQSAQFTITASPPATQSLGYYHDYLSVTATGGWSDEIALTVRVRHTERSIAISVTNDVAHPVANATLHLIQTDESVVVQAGSTVDTYNEPYTLQTDASGTATLTSVQSGTYTYTLSATDHALATGVVVVPSGSTTHTLTFTPTAKPRLVISPDALVLPVIRGTTQAKSIELTNLGAAPLTGLTITIPASPTPPNWLVLGLPLTMPVLAPGDTFSFNVLASPAASETEGIYQQYVHVEADGIDDQNLPLEVSVTSGLTRTVEVDVQDTRNRTVTEGTVLLVDQYQTPVQTPDGPRWINRYFSAEIDNTGVATFDALPISTYNLQVEAPRYFRKSRVLIVEPDTEPQTPLAYAPYRDAQAHHAQAVRFTPHTYQSRVLLPSPAKDHAKTPFIAAPLLSGEAQNVSMILTGNPFVYMWDVDPIEDEYGITFTLDYETDNGPPVVWVYPRMWRFNVCRVTIVDELTIYNPTDIPLQVNGLTVTVPGVNVVVPAFAGTVLAHGELTVPVTATVHTPAALEYGLVSAGFTYSEATPLSFDLEPFSAGGTPIEAGSLYTDAELLELLVGDAANTEISLNGSGPAWINMGLTESGAGEWDALLSVNTPEFLAEGTYHAQYLITAVDSNPTGYAPRTRTGILGVTITRTADVITLSSSFDLEEPPLYTQADQSSGIIGNSYESECDSGPGGGEDPWPSEGGGCGEGGRDCGIGGGGGGGGSTSGPDYFPPFPDYEPPPFGNGRQEARLRLGQRATLLGEAFLARLQLTNTSENPLVGTEIALAVKDLTGTVRTQDFYILPSETATLGTLALDASAQATWTIIPRTIATFTVPITGQSFLVEPTVYYSEDGIAYTDTNIMSGVITVYPAPDLIFTYRLPLPDYACTIFDLNLIIVNRGDGPARDLRLQGLAPRLEATDGSGRTLNFNITDVWVNDVPVSPNTTELSLDSLDPDPEAQSVVRWRIQASEPGRFVSFTANLQHHNPQGLPLRPLISEVRSEFVRPTDENYGGCVRTELANPQTWVKGECPFCGNEELQDYVGDPINTRSGNFSYHNTDLSVSTARGALRLERSYNSEATTGTYPYSATLGYGWSHNYEIRLWAEPRDTGQHPFLPTMTDTLRLANRIFLQAPHGSQLPFFRNFDEAGNAIFPDIYFGGGAVRASLVRDENGEYDVETARQEFYHFNAQGQLEFRRDPQGNETLYTYNEDGRLDRVTEEISDRYLEFGYDETTGMLTSVRDHAGRTVYYGYMDDDLRVFTDTRGFTWTYGYTDTHLLETVSDPLENPILQTFYDGEARAYLQLDALGNTVTEVEYASDDERTITENGVVRISSYDGTGTLVQQTVDNQPQSFTFDSYLNRNSVMDGYGNETRFARTDMGLTTAITDALTNTTRFTYDDQNRLTLTLDAQNRETRYEYDEQNNLRVMTDALQNRTVYTYNTVGQVVEQEDALGRITTYLYDTLGQLETTTDALTNTVLFEYDNLGRVITTTDALGKVSINGYDVAGNLVVMTENYTTTTDTQNYLNTYNLVTSSTYDAFNRRTETVDTLGRVTRWEYNVAGWLMEVTANYSTTPGLPGNEYNLITAYGYDEVGRQVLVTDTLGHVAFTGYTVAGQVECSIRNYVVVGEVEGCAVEYDPDVPDRNIVTRFGYDLNGRLVSTWDTLGRETRTDYDELGRVQQTIINYIDGMYSDAEPDRDIVTTYGYDATGNQTTVTDVLERVSKTEYDALNRPVVMIQNYVSPTIPGATDINITTIYTYNEVGNRVATQDPEGRVSTYEYDELNRLITVTNALTGVTVYTYDAVGNQVTALDPLGRVTLTTYDSLYRPTTVVQNYISGTLPTSDTNITTVYRYDAVGNRTTVTDPLGRVMTYDYDSLDRLMVATMNPSTTVASDLNIATTYIYDAAGRRLRVEDSDGNPTSYSYDDLGRVLTTTNALSHTTTFVYNGLGNRLETTNGEGETTSFTYDELNQLLTRTTDESRTTGYTYDGAGNRIAMTDGNGVVTCHGFDGLDRLASVTENCLEVTVNAYEDNLLTHYAYDRVGNRLAVVNARGYTTTYTYDDLNQLLSESDPLAHTTVYTYNAIGNRTVLTDPNLQVTTFAYDEMNRLEGINYPAGTADVTFDYDRVGNRLAMVDGTGTTTYTYDLLNRVVASEDGAGQLVTYDYDQMGNRTDLAFDGHAVEYAYDEANRLTTVTNGADGDFIYAYDDAGRLATLQYPNGVMTLYTYDEDGHLIELSHSTTDTLLSRYEYLIDEVGNREVITETLRVPNSGGGSFGLTEGSGTPSISTIPRSTDTPLESAPDISEDWLEGVQQTIELSEYEIMWTAETPWQDVPEAYQASNRANNLRVYFTPEDVRLVARSEVTPTWWIGFEVASIGYGAQTIPLTVTEEVVDGNRFEYHRALPGDTGDVVEWYVNGYQGVEQGFTFATPPGTPVGSEPLRVDFTLLGTTTVDLVNDAQTVEFRSSDGVVLVRYGGLYVYDANNTPLSATLSLLEIGESGTGVRLEVDDSGAVYPLTIDPLLSGPSWLATSPSADDGAQYGFVVRGAGDINNDGYGDVLIGAPTYDDPSIKTDGGAAFLYLGGADGLTTTVASVIYGSDSYAEMGASLDGIGDIDGDGYDDVILGEPGYGSGQIQVYTGTASGLSATPLFVWASADTDRTGTAVTGLGDVNDDGYPDIAIGAPDFANGVSGTENGRVIVFYGDTGTYQDKPAVRWDATGDQDYGHFGTTVSAAGDVNNDGYTDLLVGAPDDDDGTQTDEGVAFAWYGGSSGFGDEGTPGNADWSREGDQTGAGYGGAVGGAGDVNNDGYGDVIIGASQYDGISGTTTLTDGGRVYVYLGTSGGITTTLAWDAQGAFVNESLGTAVSGAGDVNNDGFSDLIVGAYNFARVYAGESTGIRETMLWEEGGSTNANFGFSVDGSGDVNDDGFSDVIVGAPTESTFFAVPGYAYGYHGGDDLITITQVVNDSPIFVDDATTFTVTLSSGTNVTYTWDFGDGNAPLVGASVLTHVYTAAGGYTAVVTASNSVAIITATTPVSIQAEFITLTRVIDYEYDPLYRLTGAEYSTGETYAYEYDEVGNRLTQTIGSDLPIVYTYDEANRLTEVAGVGHIWDDNGNLLSDGTYDYTYDAANRLVEVTAANLFPAPVIATYLYDGIGNRVGLTDTNGATVFALDVTGGLPEVIAATVDSDSTRYVQVHGQVLAQADSGTWKYILPDHLGTVRQVIDQGGEVLGYGDHDPFGGSSASMGNLDSVFGYTGEWEDESGQIFLRARYYSSNHGMFTQQDAWSGVGIKPATLHGYRYSGNDPINYVDPSGFDTIPIPVDPLAQFVTYCKITAIQCIQGAVSLGGTIARGGPVAIGGAFLAVAIYMPIHRCSYYPEDCVSDAPPAYPVPLPTFPEVTLTPGVTEEYPEVNDDLYNAPIYGAPLQERDNRPLPFPIPAPSPISLFPRTCTRDPNETFYFAIRRYNYALDFRPGFRLMNSYLTQSVIPGSRGLAGQLSGQWHEWNDIDQRGTSPHYPLYAGWAYQGQRLMFYHNHGLAIATNATRNPDILVSWNTGGTPGRIDAVEQKWRQAGEGFFDAPPNEGALPAQVLEYQTRFPGRWLLEVSRLSVAGYGELVALGGQPFNLALYPSNE